MNNEVKQELIEILEKENADLKAQIEELKKREQRLIDNISHLKASLSLPRQGLPWS
jgi:cell division protein FtsB|tara:strand:- start:171 stop:338 length:168 start_codon:yes stop_codon:yes gene_type:complete